MQLKIGGRIGDQVSAVFGVEAYKVASAPARVLDELSDEEGKASKDVSIIMDDMHAYFERQAVPAVQDGARRDAAARRRGESAAAW